jgi:alkyl sulfatase BDS1-like metallo-beta-lactamase superfamily hydrolase
MTVVLNAKHDFVFRSIRAIFDQYLGWFSGKTSDLNRDSPIIRAQNLIKLGGGAKKVFESAQIAYSEEKYQWSLELTEALCLHPEDLNISEINKFQSLILQKLASFETSVNSRNWYLTKSLEVQGLIDVKPSSEQRSQAILKSPLKNCFRLLSVNLNSKNIDQINHLVLFHFNDTNKKFSVHIRNGIADVQYQWPENIHPDNIHLIIELKTEQIWKEIIVRLKSPMQALEDEQIILKDGNGEINLERIIQFIEFLVIFAS